jgi:alkylated DNA repair dioxygenase AlkB
MEAPVTYLPDFLDSRYGAGEADNWFFRLWASLPWEHREGAPRREFWSNPYDFPYTYGTGEFARTYKAHPMTGLILRGAMMLNGSFTVKGFDCCFVNGYEHGREHLGWHADDSPEMDHDHPIAVISVGEEREIWFRRKGDQSGEAVEKLTLGNGSCVLMHAGMQREWQHRIPKSSKADCGPRISLTYRRLILNDQA